MRYFLSSVCALKRLENPSVYNVRTDELYELDEAAFAFLMMCAGRDGCESRGNDRKFLEYAISEGLITPERVNVERPLIKKSPEPSLRYLELQITRKCNLSCAHCYIGPSDGRELGIGAIRSTLEEFEEMQGLRLLITGGEPLLHAGFSSLNDLLPRYAFRKILLTNGILLSGDIIRSLNVDEVQVSVDGLEQGHDALRGKGTFRKAMRAVETTLERGVDVSVSTMVHAMNLGDFDEMARLFGSMRIKDWSVDVPCVEGNLRDNPLFQLAPETSGKYLRYGFGEGYHSGCEGFACGVHLASVMADGGVARCAFYASHPVGSVDEGLGVCWGRITPVRLDELACDCSDRESCRGGCRYRAELLGDRSGKDLYRCFAFDVYPKKLRSGCRASPEKVSAKND